jgi:hypothetical protein
MRKPLATWTLVLVSPTLALRGSSLVLAIVSGPQLVSATKRLTLLRLTRPIVGKNIIINGLTVDVLATSVNMSPRSFAEVTSRDQPDCCEGSLYALLSYCGLEPDPSSAIHCQRLLWSGRFSNGNSRLPWLVSSPIFSSPSRSPPSTWEQPGFCPC